MNEPLLTVREAATMLGFAAGTLLDWLEQNDDPPPAFKIAGRWRIRQSELEAWLEQRRNVSPTKQEIPA